MSEVLRNWGDRLAYMEVDHRHVDLILSLRLNSLYCILKRFKTIEGEYCQLYDELCRGLLEQACYAREDGKYQVLMSVVVG